LSLLKSVHICADSESDFADRDLLLI